MSDTDEDDVYSADEDGPEAMMFRHLANEEAKWSAIHNAIATWVLDRIGPKDARVALIPFRLQRYWRIPNRRRFR